MSTRGVALLAHKPEQMKGGGLDVRRRLGVVSERSLAGGKGFTSGPPCDFCGVVDGHTGQCPVVS